jgi:hypothetical protein
MSYGCCCNSRARTVLLCCVLANVSIAAGADATQTYLRWAIISSADVKESGIPDLLTAQLSSDAGIELLEREDLEVATRELELSASTTSAASAKRLQLGRLLKADALLLLSIETREQE